MVTGLRLVPVLGILCALAVGPIGGGRVEAQVLRFTMPSERELARVGLERLWWSQATINPARDKVTHITVDEHNLYVQSSAGMVTCFDAETGAKLWDAQLGRADSGTYPVTSNDEFALVLGGPVLFAVDKFSGESLWRIRLPTTPSAQPSVDDSRIYVPTGDGSVYALSLRQIGVLFEESRLPEWSGEAVEWRYQTGQEITTSPISTGRVVNFASIDKSLYSVQVETRKLLWQFETDAPIAAPLVRSGRSLYLASRDFNFYCLDAENGAVKWQFVSGLPINDSPRVIGEHVFLMPARGGMYCLDAVHGTSLWQQPKLTQFVAATPETVYATDRVGNLVLVDRGDGAIVGALPMRNFTKRYENDRTDRIYMATQGGMILALRERGREFPIFHMFPDRRPLLPEFAPDEPAEGTEPATPEPPPNGLN
jgi:outer membrane protein assembly factor BamB